MRQLPSGRGWAECPVLPVELPFALPPVALKFVDGRLTDVRLSAKSLASATAALVRKYGRPDLLDTGTVEPGQSDWGGRTGNVSWRLEGGEVLLSVTDQRKVVIHYRSNLARETELQNY